MASKPPPFEPLAAWLAAQRWFGAKSHRIGGIGIDDSIDIGPGTLHVLRVTLDDGDVQRYAVPLQPGGALADALDDVTFARHLVDLVREEAYVAGGSGIVTGHRTRAFPEHVGADAVVRKIGGEQSNTSFVVGPALI